MPWFYGSGSLIKNIKSMTNDFSINETDVKIFTIVDRFIAVICLQLSLSYNRSIDINDYLHNKKNK